MTLNTLGHLQLESTEQISRHGKIVLNYGQTGKGGKWVMGRALLAPMTGVLPMEGHRRDQEVHPEKLRFIATSYQQKSAGCHSAVSVRWKCRPSLGICLSQDSGYVANLIAMQVKVEQSPKDAEVSSLEPRI